MDGPVSGARRVFGRHQSRGISKVDAENSSVQRRDQRNFCQLDERENGEDPNPHRVGTRPRWRGERPTGVDPEGAPIDGLLGAIQATRADVSDIFLTHAHGDHIAGTGLFPGARVYLGTDDVELASGRASPEAAVAKVMGLLMPASPIRVSNPLSAQTEVPVGQGHTVRAIPVPGHTRGSMFYLFEGVLFVGDTIGYQKGQLEPGPSAFNPHPEEVNRSLQAVKPLLAAAQIDIVCAAHAGCTPMGEGQKQLQAYLSKVK